MDLVQIQAEAAAQQSSQDLGSVSEGSAESLSGENPGEEQDRQEDAMGMDRDRMGKSCSTRSCDVVQNSYESPVFLLFLESESGVGATPKPDDQTERYNMSKYDADVREKMHNLNLIILRTFVDHFYKLDNINGVQAIPFMQVRVYCYKHIINFTIHCFNIRISPLHPWTDLKATRRSCILLASFLFQE